MSLPTFVAKWQFNDPLCQDPAVQLLEPPPHQRISTAARILGPLVPWPPPTPSPPPTAPLPALASASGRTIFRRHRLRRRCCRPQRAPHTCRPHHLPLCRICCSWYWGLLFMCMGFIVVVDMGVSCCSEAFFCCGFAGDVAGRGCMPPTILPRAVVCRPPFPGLGPPLVAPSFAVPATTYSQAAAVAVPHGMQLRCTPHGVSAQHRVVLFSTTHGGEGFREASFLRHLCSNKQSLTRGWCPGLRPATSPPPPCRTSPSHTRPGLGPPS